MLRRGAPPRRRSPSRPPAWITFGFMSPFVAGLALFVAYPVVSTLYYSLTDFQTGSYRPVQFVGLANYTRLLGDDSVRTAAGNTLWMVLIMVPLRTVWAMATAWVANRVRQGRVFYRTVYFVPAMVPVVASALAFVVMLNPAGPLNHLLDLAGVTGPAWIADPAWSKPSMLMIALWACGNTMVIFSAAMLDVPRDLYEAAEIDGAGTWQQFRHVTLPALSPVIYFSLLTGMIYAFQYFTEAFVISSSSNLAADSTQTIGYPQDSLLFYASELYRQGFVFFRTGYASAMAWLLFLVIFVFTYLFIRGSRGLVHHEGGAR